MILIAIICGPALYNIHLVLHIDSNLKKNWNYHNAFFFAGTLATTIGYGNVVPRTDNGRIFCLIFVALGKNLMDFMDYIIRNFNCKHLRNTIFRLYDVNDV